MSKIAFSKIAKALGININIDIEITNISTDTRNIEKGSLFIALKGDNFDGANYIDEAFKKGAIACITENDKDYDSDGIVIVVEDTVRALQNIASIYRQQFDVSVIAITGSVGKTSTKEMVYAVLNGFSKTLKTVGNLNNHIGVPQTLFNLDNSYKNAVIEMGMSNFFEIEEISNCAMPNIAIITNIGTSHIEVLKTQEGIFKAKSEIVSGLNENGFLLLNADDTILMNHINEFSPKVLTYGIFNKNADIKAIDICYNGLETTFKVEYLNGVYSCTIPCIGEHNVLNALSGILTGAILGYEIKECCKNAYNFKNTGMRQNIVVNNGVTVIEDCYNASVDSMKASLNVLDIIKANGRKIAVLGDMLENGESSESFHKIVGASVNEHNVDILFTYGNFSKDIKTASDVKQSRHFDSKDELINEVRNIVKNGDVVLFKASRGMKLEEVIFSLYDYLDNK